MSAGTVGPDGLKKGQWVRLDLTDFPESRRQGYSRSQGPAVQVSSFRSDRYTVKDANGFAFRAYFHELAE